MTLTTSRITEGVVRRFKRARRKLVRLNEAKIREALDSCGAFKADLLLVHSSLSACGSIDGGPATVINALRSWITDRAALALPTHTWSYPDASGVAPVYDFRATPSVVGTITNYYWHQPGVVRSLHPSHSLAVSGPGAAELCRDHELRETPCGPGTPYLRIAEGNSSVLMFGRPSASFQSSRRNTGGRRRLCARQSDPAMHRPKSPNTVTGTCLVIQPLISGSASRQGRVCAPGVPQSRHVGRSCRVERATAGIDAGRGRRPREPAFVPLGAAPSRAASHADRGVRSRPRACGSNGRSVED